MTYNRQKTNTSLKGKRNIKGSNIVIVFIGLIFLLILLIAFLSNDQSGSVKFDVGSPGAGEVAPEIYLPATNGSTFDLSAYRGQKVLLFFQEGVMCQACWTQLKDIEDNFKEFKNLGIDQIVTITTDPIEPLKEMAHMNNFKTPLVSDQYVEVSSQYKTNLYGMPGMGSNYNGHSFILVDEEGVIQWRRDYGRYTMYVPIDVLLADLKKGL